MFGLDLSPAKCPGKIALTLIKSENFFQFFDLFIGSSAAPCQADSKNIYMSIANIVRSGSKNQKTFGNLHFPQNCTFPEVFRVFYSLKRIFAMDIYIFLESAWQGAADEPIKRTKN